MFELLGPKLLAIAALPLVAGVACAPVQRVAAPPTLRRVSVTLQAYPRGFRTICVKVDQAACRPFFLDTGGGVTVLTPTTARELGCDPYGRVTGFRMHGQRVDLPQCLGVSLAVGGVALRPRTVGVLDLASVGMPPDWPPVAGVLALDAFADKSIRLDLAHGSLTFVDASSPIEAPAGKEAQIRVERGIGGASLCVFVRLDTPRGPLWIEIDSGSDDTLIIDRHLAPLLGLSDSADPQTTALSWSGFGTVPTPVKTEDLIMDGNVGVLFLKHWVLTIDLKAERAWVSPSIP